MPLPRSAIGPIGRGLPLAQGSGVVTNAEAADDANGDVTARTFTRLGRLSGYALNYGTEYAEGAGLHSVQTSVELYRDAASASRGLAFWKRDDPDVSRAKWIAGASVKIEPFAVASVGDEQVAFSGSARMAGFQPVFGVDEFFRTGRLVAEVSVASGSAALSERLAPSFAKAMEIRLRGVLAGTVRESPVALAAVTRPGPPLHGPDLAALAVTTSDVGTGHVTKQGYQLDRDVAPVSEYERDMAPGGNFPSLQDTVMLFHSPREASFTLATMFGVLSSPKAAVIIGEQSFKSVAVRVSGGDESRAVLATLEVNGRTIHEVFVMVRSGSVVHSLVAGAAGAIRPSAAAALAGIAAARLGSIRQPAALER
jgi:hypothetical protein